MKRLTNEAEGNTKYLLHPTLLHATIRENGLIIQRANAAQKILMDVCPTKTNKGLQTARQITGEGRLR